MDLSQYAPLPLIEENFDGVTAEEHIAALEYLQSFERRGRPVNFGWIGEGFRALDPKRPCVVESRGLRVVDGAVVSYFHQT